MRRGSLKINIPVGIPCIDLFLNSFYGLCRRHATHHATAPPFLYEAPEIKHNHFVLYDRRPAILDDETRVRIINKVRILGHLRQRGADLLRSRLRLFYCSIIVNIKTGLHERILVISGFQRCHEFYPMMPESEWGLPSAMEAGVMRMNFAFFVNCLRSRAPTYPMPT